MQENIDLTSYGEDWVNTALDLNNVVKNITKKYPYAIFYAWSIKDEDNGVGIANFEIDGTDTEGLIDAISEAMTIRKTLLPIMAAAISEAIKKEEDVTKKKKYKDAILKILNF